jgi:hypothetical protein
VPAIPIPDARVQTVGSLTEPYPLIAVLLSISDFKVTDY